MMQYYQYVIDHILSQFIETTLIAWLVLYYYFLFFLL